MALSGSLTSGSCADSERTCRTGSPSNKAMRPDGGFAAAADRQGVERTKSEP